GQGGARRAAHRRGAGELSPARRRREQDLADHQGHHRRRLQDHLHHLAPRDGPLMSTLVIFARAPVAGEVKTRLAQRIGAPAALALYEAFLDDTCTLTQGLGARRVLAIAGDATLPHLAHLCKSQRLELTEQGEGDLGARMAHAIATYAANGPVVIVGSD